MKDLNAIGYQFGRIAAIAVIALAGVGTQGQSLAAPDLSSMSLEQLTSVGVNTVSRREQKLFDTPAAAYVITQEDIQRSGATNVPELLRMVPGLQVAQIDANKWAVSARGFNSRFANKMLIMIDGRSIYNPVYSGTLWDQNDLLLEDIDRIEVVRGPGGTMWGANAVNGVINIETTRSRGDHGAFVTAEGGRMEQGIAVRFGASPGPASGIRAFAKVIHHSPLLSITGGEAQDGGDSQRVGGRWDWEPSRQNSVSLQGNLFRNPEQQRIMFGYDPTDFLLDSVYGAGGYAMGRWKHKGGVADEALQAYYSDEHRNEIGMKLNMQTVDIDFQQHAIAGGGNEIVWGAGFRWTSDFASGNQAFFSHSDHLVNLYSTFVQDSLALSPSVVLTAGTKLQWNTYTKLEVQPRASLLWTPDPAQTVWMAVSRAVRTPSDQDHDVNFTYPLGSEDGLPLYGQILGNPDLASERVIAYESGYRRRLGHWASLDTAAFLNRYRDLEGTSVGAPALVESPSAYLVLPFNYVNGFSAHSEGVEAALTWPVLTFIQLRASYAWMQARLESYGAVSVQPSGGQDWSTPRNTFDVRAYVRLTRHWDGTAILNGNSAVPSSLGVPGTVVAGHTRMDLQIRRPLGESVQFTAGATNLYSASHEEFYPEDYTLGSSIPRSIYFKLQWNR